MLASGVSLLLMSKREGADEGTSAPLPCSGAAEGLPGRSPCPEAEGSTVLGPGEAARRGELGFDILPAKMGVPLVGPKRPG